MKEILFIEPILKACGIEVNLENSGTDMIEVIDNGSGMDKVDSKNAFLRHATSKIKDADDLNSILTLGFRGEALASVCAVSRTEIMTKQKDDDLGTHYMIEGSEETLYEQTGCPDGTTIIIRDLFYNVPARQKFMKKDAVEGNMVCSIVNRIALSHPEIAFKLLRDNKLEFSTAGDGKLYSSIFAVYGKAFAGDMIPVEYEQDGIKISGGTLKSGTVDCYGDHRIAMAAAIASVVAGDVTIKGAEAVSKSYPAFWEDFRRLGGTVVFGD